uniref:Uncharacterized protein n=1 Tax=Polysiphonia elongata TaxID=159753 RepID=A0A1Z1MBF3_9FLOR|nr:hypothetical protein [Polysiphonia elongata]ARW63306.1 hypothetical protein [Polysiphonia elongata]
MLYYLRLKSALPFIYLIFLPYKYIQALFTILIILILSKKRKIYFYKILKNIKNNVFFILCTLLSLLYTNYNYLSLSNILEQLVLFPYFLKFTLKKNFILSLDIYYIKFIIPNYTIKANLINTLNIITTSNLFLVTKNEILLNYLHIWMNNNSKIQHKSYKLLLMTFLTSYEIVEKILIKFYSLYIGLRSKNHISLKNIMNNINCFTQNLAEQIIEENYMLMLTIWNRF